MSCKINIFWFGLDNQSTRERKKVPDIYTISWPPWRTKEVLLQHGGSILGSVILCGTFRRMSQLWDNAYTLNLENCLLYLSSTISQFFYFIRCLVFDFICYCVTASHYMFCQSWRWNFSICLLGNVSSDWKLIWGRLKGET